ncbi:unnamed protein product [Amaranthus hypochondriacus]
MMRLKSTNNPLSSLQNKRDAYGFAIRPQHVQRYREYATIYQEEEEERSDRWNIFLEMLSESIQLSVNGEIVDTYDNKGHLMPVVDTNLQAPDESVVVIDTSTSEGSIDDKIQKPEVPLVKAKKLHKVQIWSEIRPSLRAIEDIMSVRVNNRSCSHRKEPDTDSHKILKSIEQAKSFKGAAEDDSEEEFYDVEKSDPVQDVPSVDTASTLATVGIVEGTNLDSSSPWKTELESFVRGGLPMALRGELWQAFVGVKARRVENYYEKLLDSESNYVNKVNQEETIDNDSGVQSAGLCEKWKGQIEKDLPRTFPGHPALDENGRNALRRLLIAYARHKPSVGYCQAMNFFAGLLLLLMPEENAFWTLMGIMDDYFDGYYSEEMIECQVDQHVFEDLMRERFPKLVNHLDYLGVEVGCVTGPWFLSIFINMLPWESGLVLYFGALLFLDMAQYYFIYHLVDSF